MNYTITPSTDPPQSDVSLRVATATFDVEGRNFLITTPWNTIFRHKLVLTSAFPGGPIDAYIEEPDNDSVNGNGKQGGGGGEGEGEVKLVPKNVGMIYVKQSEEVPVGAKLVRVWGSEELWMLYFPPKPLVAVAKGTQTKETKAAAPVKEATKADGQAKKTKEAAKGEGTKEAGKAEETKVGGKAEETKKQPSSRRLGEFDRHLAEVAAARDKSGSFSDTYYERYAAHLGHGVTADEVRVFFADAVANPLVRGLTPDFTDGYWEDFWQLLTRGGTLKGTASSHWRKGYDKSVPPETTKVMQAMELQTKPFGGLQDAEAFDAMAEGNTPFKPEELRYGIAKLICNPKYRRIHGDNNDAHWDYMWQTVTGGKPVEGLPKHWKDKA